MGSLNGRAPWSSYGRIRCVETAASITGFRRWQHSLTVDCRAASSRGLASIQLLFSMGQSSPENSGKRRRNGGRQRRRRRMSSTLEGFLVYPDHLRSGCPLGNSANTPIPGPPLVTQVSKQFAEAVHRTEDGRFVDPQWDFCDHPKLVSMPRTFSGSGLSVDNKVCSPVQYGLSMIFRGRSCRLKRCRAGTTTSTGQRSYPPTQVRRLHRCIVHSLSCTSICHTYIITR